MKWFYVSAKVATTKMVYGHGLLKQIYGLKKFAVTTKHFGQRESRSSD
jgi:hypothetical protein